MPSSQLPIRDAADGRPVRLFDDASILWTSGRERWRGLVVERIHVPGLDTPSFRIAQHSLVLHLSSPTLVEQTIQGGARRSMLGPGDLSLFSAGARRRLQHGPREMLVVSLADELVAREAARSGARGAPAVVEQHRIRDPQLELLVRALGAEAEGGYPSGQAFGESLAAALAARLVGAYAPSVCMADAAPAMPVCRGGIPPARLRRVLEHVESHLAEPLPLEALARIARLSPHRFAHNFKHATGLAPHRFVVQARLRRAEALLRTSDRTIAEIALDCGFGSASRFALHFRRATGLAPAAFRAALR